MRNFVVFLLFKFDAASSRYQFRHRIAKFEHFDRITCDNVNRFQVNKNKAQVK